MSEDTIFALGTGPVRAAIAVVRISGPRACGALTALAGTLPPERRLAFRRFRTAAGEVLDEGMAVWFRGPATETGEDCAELHLHGSPGVIQDVLGELARLPGLRPAGPGEFTMRALRNGRIDLTQAEGLADLIEAETPIQRRQALGQLGGRLSERVSAWRTLLVGALAALDAELDFADEADAAGRLELSALASTLAELGVELDSLARDRRGERIRDGLAVLVAGPPNAGKSSLVNALAGRPVAIVTDIPGTTRDLLEATIDVDGVSVTLIDSAGLRESSDPVERIGVEVARSKAREVDLVLWLSPADRPAAPDAALQDRPVLHVRSKADLSPGNDALTPASVYNQDGLDPLRDRLRAEVAARAGGEPAIVTRERHRRMLSEAAGHVRRAATLLAGDGPLELASEDLRLAARALDALVGRIDVEDVLSDIFSRFCIGK